MPSGPPHHRPISCASPTAASGPRSATASDGVFEIDPDHAQVTGRLPDDVRIRPGARVAPGDFLEASVGLLVHEVSYAPAPLPSGLDAHLWVGEQVAHVVRARAVLRNDPEAIAVEGIGDRRQALAATAASC